LKHERDIITTIIGALTAMRICIFTAIVTNGLVGVDTQVQTLIMGQLLSFTRLFHILMRLILWELVGNTVIQQSMEELLLGIRQDKAM
jgi:hypothetical protein